MTHHTDAERAEFERTVADEMYGGLIELISDHWDSVKGEYKLFQHQVVWIAWQAARRVPEAPVPQGWKDVAELCAQMCDSRAKSLAGDAHIAAACEARKCASVLRNPPDYWREKLEAAAPQPPEAAPDCLTCNDHGAVGNILNAEPCPDCTMKRGTGCSVSNGETQTAPVELPEYGIDTANHAGIRVRGYTEQQVRDLLAAIGIKVTP